jgi:tetratricopeptide (TPR) repeat protein
MENYAEAEKLYQESLDIYKSLGEQRFVASVTGSQAELLIKTGKIRVGCQLLEQRLKLERAYGDQGTVLSVLEILGSTLLDQDELDESYSYYEEALVLGKTLGDLTAQVLCLQGIGRIQEIRGESELAHQSLRKSLTLALKSGYSKLIVVSYDQLGLYARKIEDYGLANEYLEAGLSFISQLGLKREKGQILFSLGSVASMQGKLKDSLRNYQEAFEIYRQLGDKLEMGYCLVQQSLVSLTNADVHKAWDYLNRAIKIFQGCQDADLKAMIVQRLTDFLEISEYQTAAKQILSSEMSSSD